MPFLTTNRLGGFIVLVIYMVTSYSVYVPDWSYVYHMDGDIDDGKQFTVLGAYARMSSLLIILVYDTLLFFNFR